MATEGIAPHIEQNQQRILIVGCGKIGLRLANTLADEHLIWGLRRSTFESPSISFIAADVTDPASLKDQLPQKIDYLIYCLTPNEMSEAGYRAVYVDGLQNILNELSAPLKRLYFVSSTSVYHQDDSSIVDEHSPTLPKRFSGQVLLNAEKLALESAHPSTVIRFSGIYGGNRSRLIDQVLSGEATLTNQSRLTNRIHEDDCVGFLKHLIDHDISGRASKNLYIATDSEPSEYNQVIRFIADTKGIELTKGTDTSKRRAGNKRCSNQRMLETGYELTYPNFRIGYAAMLEAYLPNGDGR